MTREHLDTALVALSELIDDTQRRVDRIDRKRNQASADDERERLIERQNKALAAYHAISDLIAAAAVGLLCQSRCPFAFSQEDK